MRNSFYVRHGKRFLDFLASLLGLVLLSPVICILAVVVKLSDRGPVFFIQSRVGMRFKTFRFIKFRTMLNNAEAIGPQVTTEKDHRITRVGRFLRRTKLDELPQLLNVLWGDISLVGPRPEVAKYVEAYKSDYEEILEVRPGITDFSAIEFIDEQTRLMTYKNPEEGYIKEVLPQKIAIYKEYLRDVNLFTDLKLIFLTLWKVIK